MPFFPALSNAQRRLSQTLVNFKFECIGNNQTDDELVIANSLKEFGKLIAAIEDEKDRLLDRAFDQFIVPLENFRKEHIGAVKERKKKFEKQTAKLRKLVDADIFLHSCYLTYLPIQIFIQ